MAETTFNFNLRTAPVYRAVKYEKSVFFRFFRWCKNLFLILFILLFGIFLYAFFVGTLNKAVLSDTFGFSLVFLTLFLTSRISISFLNSKLKTPKLKAPLEEVLSHPENYNLAEFLSFEVLKAVNRAFGFTKTKRLSETNLTAIFYYLILDNPNLNFIFSRALLNLKDLKNSLKDYLGKIPRGSGGLTPLKDYLEKTPDGDGELTFLKDYFGKVPHTSDKFALSEQFRNLILESFKLAQKRNHQRMEVGDIITLISKYDLVFGKILIDAYLKTADIENLTWWLDDIEERIARNKKFWEKENLLRKGSIGKAWAAGYTPTLDQFSSDWTEIIKRRGVETIVGSEDEVAEMERTLSRGQSHNILLIGEPGSGRKSVIQALAQKVFLGQSLPEVNYKRVVSLDVVSILTRYESFEETEKVLDNIFNEVLSAGNVILVIDEFYSFVSQASGKPGAIDISPILGRYLPLQNFYVIGITSFQGLHLFIERNPTILNYFGTVKVSEMTEEETIRILENSLFSFEAKYKKFISYQALKDIVKYSAKYIQDNPFPKKALDLLEEVVIYTNSYTKSKVVLPEYVSKIVSKKTDIPVGQLETKEKEVLLGLENLIHQRIINQEEAVKEVSTALRRARAEVTVRKGPMGTFLFLGPTGVGKTETAKALAEVYFGSEEKIIRLDMSEFQNVTDIPRLLGSATEEGLLTTKIREAPFSLILLDELEKAHPNILNLFLQVLDEGFITDGVGRKIDFKNSIIIATSNAGYQIILQAQKETADWLQVKTNLLSYIFQQGTFKPEFINRFDAVVLFKTLSKENLLSISQLLLGKLRANLKEKEIEFIITEPLKEKIAELGFDPTFGARQMRRVIQDKVENALASALISGQLKRSDKVEINPEDFTLKISPQ
ncbi:MAG: hypothetical protein A2175_02025 [Candidatus Nealsonbacteria bacterium RBG_13_42_11]|uniref:Clp R domain-containing protein n=1 Tax=Candidatus Nealsonbacteria bacterium RBG_13_42_11 TaxID=1801663 RepID=A0A1G2E1P3_9BACT|nr:MAG: hypothetical protein A2175_02025 [Candidatus Nealsonbacteria bacterium RBG_13_42_11]